MSSIAKIKKKMRDYKEQNRQTLLSLIQALHTR